MVGRKIKRYRSGDSGNQVEVVDVAGIDIGSNDIEVRDEVNESGIDVDATPVETIRDTSGPEVIDPASIGVGTSGEPIRRRGRKPGVKNRTKVATFQAGNLEKLLLSGHLMLAAVTGANELVIDETEAKLLADSIAAVNAAYGLDSIISPKVAAAIDLSFACAAVYGPRLLKIAKRAKPKKPILVRRDDSQHEKPFHTFDAGNITLPEDAPPPA
jgi:hypothetical protein